MISARRAKHLDSTHVYILSCKHISRPIRARLVSLLFINVVILLYSSLDFSFFVLNILAAWLDHFSRDPTLTSNRIFVHGFCSKFLQQKWSMKNFLRLKVFFYFVQGGSHVAGLNFKTSRVVVYKCLTSLSEIERKWFIFVQILEKGDSDRL